MVTRLTHTTSIKSEAGKYTGRLGILLSDNSCGRMIALTARQIVRGGGAIIANGSIVGDIAELDDKYEGDDERPAWTLIEKVRILPTQAIEMQRIRVNQMIDPLPISLAPSLLDVAGTTVLVHTSKDAPRLGFLRSIYALFQMPLAGERSPTLFYDALAIESVEGEPLAVSGDAGAIVTDMDGAATGIIICTIKGTSYAAPLQPLLATNGHLVAASDKAVSEWNMAMAPRRRATFLARSERIEPARTMSQAVPLNQADEDTINESNRLLDLVL